MIPITKVQGILMGKLKRVIFYFLFALTFSVAISSLLSCEKEINPASSGSGLDCGSGKVSWDANVQRCRDISNGQFVKSCCCGH